MMRMRGLVALAGLLALAGCGDENGCPGIGEHSGGIVNVRILGTVDGDCTTPTSDEISIALISPTPDVCPVREVSYDSDAQCNYSVTVGCEDDLGTWAFGAQDIFYVGDGAYEGTVRFARGDLSGDVICTGRFNIRYTNIR